MRSYGVASAMRDVSSANLASTGEDEAQQGVGMMGKAADEEQQRNAFNQQVRASNKSGNAQMGATAGAVIGSFFGMPMVGAALGGVIGGML